MADAAGGGGSSWSALEIIFVILLAIGFLTQLQNGFSSQPKEASSPITTSTEQTCGITISRPQVSQSVYSSIALTGEVFDCQWQPTESVALYAQVVDSTGRALSSYVAVSPIFFSQERRASFDTVITFSTPSKTSKGFLILVPAKNTGQQTMSYRIPLIFARN